MPYTNPAMVKAARQLREAEEAAARQKEEEKNKNVEASETPQEEPKKEVKAPTPEKEEPVVKSVPQKPKTDSKPAEPKKEKPKRPALKKQSSSASGSKRVSLPEDGVNACRDYLMQLDREADAPNREGWGFAGSLTFSDCVMFAIGMLMRSTDIQGMSEPVKLRVQYCLDNGDSVADLKESWSRRFDAIDKRLQRIDVGCQTAVQAEVLLVLERYGLTPANVASATHPGGVNFSPPGIDAAVKACRQSARTRMNQEHRPQSR